MKSPMTHRSTSRIRTALFGALCVATAFAARAEIPVVTGITAAQRAGTKLVDISYTVSDADSTSVNVGILVSADSGNTWTIPALTFSGAYGPNVPVTAFPTVKTIVWNAEADWNGNITTQCRVRVLASNGGQRLIPPGTYLRGNTIVADADITDAPINSVNISPFFIDSTLVTGAQWNLVLTYAGGHNYSFVNAGSATNPTYPVHTVNWFDTVKWCNARSEMEGVAPVYYTDSACTVLYKTGQPLAPAPYVKSGANGYRLPTEAEWEKAARGGAAGLRFPWGETIDWSHANYHFDGVASYDTQVYLGDFYDPRWSLDVNYNLIPQPYISPVASFSANTYNLYDMAGNLQEWCWDWYKDTYYAAGQADPQGPSSGTYRVLRGGSWAQTAEWARCARRHKDSPSVAYNSIGFRCVRGL